MNRTDRTLVSSLSSLLLLKSGDVRRGPGEMRYNEMRTEIQMLYRHSTPHTNTTYEITHAGITEEHYQTHKTKTYI